MITVKIKGGLGSQLFAYAAGYALAKRLGQPLQMDVSFYDRHTRWPFLLNQLNLEYNQTVTQRQLPLCVRLLRMRQNTLRRRGSTVNPCCGNGVYLLETEADQTPEFFSVNAEWIYLDGHFHNESFFREHRNALLRQFSGLRPADESIVRLEKEVESCCSVAVHVRRGPSMNPKILPLSADYYHRALDYMDRHLENPTYYWFCDDPEWVRSTIGEKENFRFVPTQTPATAVDQMMLMRRCRHIIAANSTFSWWAAWLNTGADALRIVPARNYGTAGMIPHSWLRM